MTTLEKFEMPHIATIDVDGRRYNVALRIEHDGVEFVGRLWFADEAWAEDDGIVDQGVVPGRSAEIVIAHAQSLGERELVSRYRRALAQKRRFHDRDRRSPLCDVVHDREAHERQIQQAQSRSEDGGNQIAQRRNRQVIGYLWCLRSSEPNASGPGLDADLSLAIPDRPGEVVVLGLLDLDRDVGVDPAAARVDADRGT